MALRKTKNPTTLQSYNVNNTNDGLNSLFLGSQSENTTTYNSPISYFNKENNTNDNDESNEEIQELENNKPMKYESKDDVIPIKRTSKTDNELKKLMNVTRKERKVLNIDSYKGSVSDILIEEVVPPMSEKYFRARIIFQVINDEPIDFIKIDVFANLNLDYNSKLSRLIRGITGKDAGEEFDLTSLRGKKVIVRTKHITDKQGNINHAIDTIEKGNY